MRDNSGKESRGACPAEGRVGFADAPMRGNRQVSSHNTEKALHRGAEDLQKGGRANLVKCMLPPAGNCDEATFGRPELRTTALS
jgi:hypothetical protein